MPDIKAIIADDEPNIRNYIRSKLAKLWPELAICAEAGDGITALDMIRSEKPDIAFLDIRMPGLSGIQVAEKAAGSCRVVFITAHDNHAVDAFKNEAVDYLLKPVTVDRLKKTVARLKARMHHSAPVPDHVFDLLRRMMTSAASADKPRALSWIKAPCKDGMQIIPVDDIYYFTKQDQYTALVTVNGEFLISTPIKQLATELDADRFWQIHRATIVNVNYIQKVSRSVTGRGVIKLKNRPETLTISRSFLHLFRQM